MCQPSLQPPCISNRPQLLYRRPAEQSLCPLQPKRATQNPGSGRWPCPLQAPIQTSLPPHLPAGPVSLPGGRHGLFSAHSLLTLLGGLGRLTLGFLHPEVTSSHRWVTVFPCPTFPGVCFPFFEKLSPQQVEHSSLLPTPVVSPSGISALLCLPSTRPCNPSPTTSLCQVSLPVAEKPVPQRLGSELPTLLLVLRAV